MKHSSRTVIWEEMGFATYASSISFDRREKNYSRHFGGQNFFECTTVQRKTICNLFELNICHFVGTNATRAQPTKFKR